MGEGMRLRLLSTLCLSIAIATIPCITKGQEPTTTPEAQPQCDCAQASAMESDLNHARAILKDWPNLARYREANAGLQAPARGEKRVVFMGDSITDGWNRPEYGPFFPGKPYIDRGISGQTTPQMLIRMQPDVIALKPKVVVILAGTNDIAGNTGSMTLEEIEANYKAMSELARSNGIKVVWSSVTPVYDGGHNREGKEVIMTDRRPPEKILALNAWLKKYTADHGYVYLDYFSAMVDEKGFMKRGLSKDGLHPNAEGYAVMAPLAEKAIERSLRRK
jgi:lysophospholipase L1-like esterase